MKVKSCNYFLKSFEEMNLINKRFNVYDIDNKLMFENCYINDRGYVCYESNELWGITMSLLTGNDYYEIISNKKKLRDLTEEEWDKWNDENCKNCKNCSECIFKNIVCHKSWVETSWVNNKDLYSDKFLDQEIEVEE